MAENILKIYNLTLVRLGEDRLATILDDSEPRRKLDEIYDNVLEQVTVAGPQKGWKFAKDEKPVSVDSSSITAFADYSGTVAGTVLVTSAAHGLVTGDLVEIDDTTNYDDEYQVTVVNVNTFYITATWVADDATGTVYWTSADYAYRYAIPTAAKRVVKADVLGIELTDWITRGEYILTNLEDDKIWVEYVQSITDTTLFPPWFTKVLYMSLAIELAYNLLQNAAQAERLEDKLENKILPKAIALDEQEKHVKESSTAWVDAGRN